MPGTVLTSSNQGSPVSSVSRSTRPQPPARIEGYDISTFYGTATYGSMVVFVHGVPRKSEWNAIRRLGHVDQLDALAHDAETYRHVVPLISAADMSLDPSHTPATNG